MRRFRIWGVTFVISTVVVMSSVVQTNADSAAPAIPGSADDPVVTKSYVDQQISQLVAAEVTKQLSSLPTGGSGASGNTVLTVVKLLPGQTLMAGKGSELIVRNGTVLAVSNDTNGIPDVTEGKDIPAGAVITTNHLLVFPSDKRGIIPDPKQKADIYVMVRGDYKIVQ